MTKQHSFLAESACHAESFSDAAKVIQDAIGCTDGLAASLFEPEAWEGMAIEEKRDLLSDYIAFEKQFSKLSPEAFDAICHKRKES